MAPGVRRLIAMELVSGIGDGVFWVGLTAVLLERDVGAEGFALAVLARLGPRALMSSPAGILADRVDRRALLVGLDLGRAAVMLALAVSATAKASSAVLLALVLVAYTLASPYRPAVAAALPLVAGEERLSAANALIGTTRQVMTFVGPVFGAVILTWSTPAAAFAFNAVSFAVSGYLLLGVPALSIAAAGRSHEPASRWTRELRDGLRDATATAGLVVVTLLVFAMYAARGSELVLYVLYSADRLGWDARGVGVLSASIGLGALWVLPFASRVAEGSHLPAAMLVAVATTAVPLVGLAVVESGVIACMVLVVLGAGVVLFEVLSVVLVQRLVHLDRLGTVFGFVATASNAGKLIGALSAPPLVAAVGLRSTLVLTGGAVGIAGLAAMPGLRSLALAVRTRGAQLRPLTETFAALLLFDGASRASLERLAAAAIPENLPPDTVVLREGEPAEDLYVVLDGQLEVMTAGQVVNALGPGDWFGEIGLLMRRPRTATVRTVTSARIVRIPGMEFLGAAGANAAEHSPVYELMADRLARSEAALKSASRRSEPD